MRDIAVVSIVFIAAVVAIAHPYVGVLAWTWVSVMNPHRLAWGFAVDFPVAYVIAIGTLIGLVVSRDRKRLPVNAPVIVLFLFVLWMCFTSVMAIHPELGWDMFNRVMKIMFMVFIAMIVLHSRKHIDLLVWVLVISLGFYGAKGGLFTVLTGGSFRVWGPPGGFIEGNNEIALALIIAIPLMRYLQLIATQRWIRLGLGAGMVLSALAALGSQSRGALIAIAAMCALLWWRSEHKLVWGVLLGIVGVSFVAFLPETWMARMETISIENADSSIRGRLNAWGMAWNLAVDRPIGGGFEIITPDLFAQYAPDPHAIHAAHSIYFQVLGEHGFPGLVLFLLLWALVWRWAGRMYREGAASVENKWAAHLGGMIQVSLIGYLVGGAFLSLAYFDLPYNLLILVVAARGVLDEAAQKARKSATAVVSTGVAATGQKYA